VFALSARICVGLFLLILLASCSRPAALPPVAPTAMTHEPSDTRIKIQCLDVEATMPPGVASNGILVLDSRVDNGSGRYKNLDTYFMDMAARTTIQVVKSRENLADFAIGVPIPPSLPTPAGTPGPQEAN